MAARVARVSLSFAALLLVAGGALHAVAFRGASLALSASPMQPFYSGSFKALWLIDSATLISLGALLAFLVVRPQSVTRWVLCFLALVPGATAAFIYVFVGAFLPAHVFVAAALLMLIAAFSWHAHEPAGADSR